MSSMDFSDRRYQEIKMVFCISKQNNFRKFDQRVANSNSLLLVAPME